MFLSFQRSSSERLALPMIDLGCHPVRFNCLTEQYWNPHMNLDLETKGFRFFNQFISYIKSETFQHCIYPYLTHCQIQGFFGLFENSASTLQVTEVFVQLFLENFSKYSSFQLDAIQEITPSSSPKQWREEQYFGVRFPGFVLDYLLISLLACFLLT